MIEFVKLKDHSGDIWHINPALVYCIFSSHDVTFREERIKQDFPCAALRIDSEVLFFDMPVLKLVELLSV